MYVLLLYPQDEDGAPRSKKPRPMAEHTLEECDSTEEYATLFVVSEDGTVTQRVSDGDSFPSHAPSLLVLRSESLLFCTLSVWTIVVERVRVWHRLLVTLSNQM